MLGISECQCVLSSSRLLFLSFSNTRKRPKFNLARCPEKPAHPTCVLKVGVEDVAEIINNKVLIAAGASAAIGQLSKPFTSVILYGKNLDFRTAFQAGGFPSTHSSTVVAAATALALERGFADSIFGLSVVYAGLIMYDAQGVRREVGNHARVFNKMLLDGRVNPRRDEMNTLSFLSKPSLKRVKQSSEWEEGDQRPLPSLKESIGHTEAEVVAGALLGFVVCLAVYAVI